MKNLPFIALWLLVFSIPWSNMFVIEGVGTATRAFGIIAFIIAAFYIVANGKIRTLKIPLLAITLFVLWAITSFFWSLAPDETFGRIWTYLQLLVMVWLIWQLSRNKLQQKSLLQAFVIGAYVSLAGTFVNHLLGEEVNPLRYAASGWDPNDLGMVLALGIPISWYLSLTTERALWVMINRLYIPLAGAAILLTSSRTAVAAGIVALLIIPWTISKVSPRVKLSMLLGLIACGFLFYTFIPASSWARLSTIPTEITEGTLSSRVDIWEAGWTVFLSHPLQGVGSGAFSEAITPVYGAPKVAHNVFLSILTENGIIGFSLFMFISIICLHLIFKLKGLERKLWAILIMTWIVGALFLSWEYRHPSWLLLALLVTQAYATRDTENEPVYLRSMSLQPGKLSDYAI